jgi:cytochrome c-type biogenesis protein CcmH/NrfF
MPRLKTLLLAALLTTLSLAQNPMDFLSPEIKRVGMKLACLCGSCRNSVGDCSMLGCSYAFPARQKIKQYQTMGMSDQNIIGRFVKERGKMALAVPEAEGFGLLGWLMPGFAVALGLIALLVYAKRFRNPAVAAAPVEWGPEEMAAYESTAAQELERIEVSPEK